jgi:ComF family protein
MSVAAILRFALDAVLPPRCLSCGEIVVEAGVLCAACWRGVAFIAAPFCERCGLPFPHEAAGICAACAAAPPHYDRARAVFRYDTASRELVIAFKHADKTHAAPAYGAWMRRAGAALLEEADLLVPVPLHWTRLFRRRYNQAALLAYAIDRGRVVPDLLVRRRPTASQGHLGRSARSRNVTGAFAVRSGAGVAGKRIVLVDDVMTTGATVGECARVLRRAGAARVDVLTLARVVREGA